MEYTQDLELFDYDGSDLEIPVESKPQTRQNRPQSARPFGIQLRFKGKTPNQENNLKEFEEFVQTKELEKLEKNFQQILTDRQLQNVNRETDIQKLGRPMSAQYALRRSQSAKQVITSKLERPLSTYLQQNRTVKEKQKKMVVEAQVKINPMSMVQAYGQPTKRQVSQRLEISPEISKLARSKSIDDVLKFIAKESPSSYSNKILQIQQFEKIQRAQNLAKMNKMPVHRRSKKSLKIPLLDSSSESEQNQEEQKMLQTTESSHDNHIVETIQVKPKIKAINRKKQLQIKMPLFSTKKLANIKGVKSIGSILQIVQLQNQNPMTYQIKEPLSYQASSKKQKISYKTPQVVHQKKDTKSQSNLAIQTTDTIWYPIEQNEIVLKQKSRYRPTSAIVQNKSPTCMRPMTARIHNNNSQQVLSPYGRPIKGSKISEQSNFGKLQRNHYPPDFTQTRQVYSARHRKVRK